MKLFKILFFLLAAVLVNAQDLEEWNGQDLDNQRVYTYQLTSSGCYDGTGASSVAFRISSTTENNMRVTVAIQTLDTSCTRGGGSYSMGSIFVSKLQRTYELRIPGSVPKKQLKSVRFAGTGTSQFRVSGVSIV